MPGGSAKLVAGRNAGRVVMVTGASRYLGARVAARLAADPRVDHVVGVDVTPPPPELAPLLDRVELEQADLTRSAAVVARHEPSAVVHLGVATAPEIYPGSRPEQRELTPRGWMKEQNIIGTMQLLAACQRLASLRTLVVRSSTAAYGASFRDPAVFTEETEPREVPRGGFGRDILDIEGYVRSFRRRSPKVTTTVLRFAPLIGSAADTSLTRYFAQPVVPTVFGRDPRLQFLQVDDALEILYRSVVEDHPGVFNVAGPGVLTLSQAIRRAGRVPLPVAEVGLSSAAEFARRLGRQGLGQDQIDLFVHGRVVDTTKLIKEYGVTPHSTASAFADFLVGRTAGRPPLLARQRWQAAEQAVLATIARVRAARADEAGQR